MIEWPVIPRNHPEVDHFDWYEDDGLHVQARCADETYSIVLQGGPWSGEKVIEAHRLVERAVLRQWAKQEQQP